MSNRGLLVVYAGASGVGKGTIMKKLLALLLCLAVCLNP